MYSEQNAGYSRTWFITILSYVKERQCQTTPPPFCFISLVVLQTWVGFLHCQPSSLFSHYPGPAPSPPSPPFSRFRHHRSFPMGVGPSGIVCPNYPSIFTAVGWLPPRHRHRPRRCHYNCKHRRWQPCGHRWLGPVALWPHRACEQVAIGGAGGGAVLPDRAPCGPRQGGGETVAHCLFTRMGCGK